MAADKNEEVTVILVVGAVIALGIFLWYSYMRTSLNVGTSTALLNANTANNLAGQKISYQSSGAGIANNAINSGTVSSIANMFGQIFGGSGNSGDYGSNYVGGGSGTSYDQSVYDSFANSSDAYLLS